MGDGGRPGWLPLGGHRRDPGRANPGDHTDRYKAAQPRLLRQRGQIGAGHGPDQQRAEPRGHTQPVGPLGGVDLGVALEPSRIEDRKGYMTLTTHNNKADEMNLRELEFLKEK